jgi:hypothetical protein
MFIRVRPSAGLFVLLIGSDDRLRQGVAGSIYLSP